MSVQHSVCRRRADVQRCVTKGLWLAVTSCSWLSSTCSRWLRTGCCMQVGREAKYPQQSYPRHDARQERGFGFRMQSLAWPMAAQTLLCSPPRRAPQAEAMPMHAPACLWKPVLWFASSGLCSKVDTSVVPGMSARPLAHLKVVQIVPLRGPLSHCKPRNAVHAFHDGLRLAR